MSLTEFFTDRSYEPVEEIMDENPIGCVDTNQLFIHGSPNTIKETSVYIALEKQPDADLKFD